MKSKDLIHLCHGNRWKSQGTSLRKTVAAASGALLLLVPGCARLEVKPVMPGERTEGVHFYEPAPYLLVTKTVNMDKEGNATEEYVNQILWLPDKRQRYSVRVRPGWGTVDGSIKLVDGWRLESLGSKMDSKGPETISAFAGLVKEAAAAIKETEDKQPKSAQLYRILIDESGRVRLEPQESW